MWRVEFGEAVDIIVPVKKPSGAVIEVQEKMPFKDFLIACVTRFAKFKEGPEMGRVYGKIRRAIDNMTAEQRQVDFQDAHWKLIKESVSKSSWLTPDINAAMEPHYDSVDAGYDLEKKRDQDREL